MKTNEIDLNVPEGTENKEDYLMEQIEEESIEEKLNATGEVIKMVDKDNPNIILSSVALVILISLFLYILRWVNGI